jgi:hypothetical protein
LLDGASAFLADLQCAPLVAASVADHTATQCGAISAQPLRGAGREPAVLVVALPTASLGRIGFQ